MVTKRDQHICNPEIALKGKPVAILRAPCYNAVDKWMRDVMKNARARLDWRLLGRDIVVLHLGDSESRMRVETTINTLTSSGGVKVSILRRYPA